MVYPYNGKILSFFPAERRNGKNHGSYAILVRDDNGLPEGGFMSRVKDLPKQVHRILKGMENHQKRANAIAHLHGMSLAAVVIAKKERKIRSLPPWRDSFTTYMRKNGSYKDHAHLGQGMPGKS